MFFLFIRISKACRVQLEDILLFDDTQYNIYEMERLGVVSIKVTNGLTGYNLMEGLKKFTDVRKENENEFL